MSSNYHDQGPNSKHHYKTHRENNTKNKFVIYVEKKQGSQTNLSNSQETKQEPKQEEISMEKQKVIREKAVESYEKFQEKEKTGDYKDRKNQNPNNYQKKRSGPRQDGNSRSISYHYSNDDKGISHHQFLNEGFRKASTKDKEITKERLLKEFERVHQSEVSERIKEFAKNYGECFSMDIFEPENNLEAAFSIKDAFSRNTGGGNPQDNPHSNMGRHQGNNYRNNQEEQMPAWATWEVNDPMNKNFEFRTIEKPERHKKEESIPIQKIPEKRKSFDLPIKEEAKQLEEDHDQVFYDHIDRLMEEKLKINGPAAAVEKEEENNENEEEEIPVKDENEDKEEPQPLWGAEEVKPNIPTTDNAFPDWITNPSSNDNALFMPTSKPIIPPTKPQQQQPQDKYSFLPAGLYSAPQGVPFQPPNLAPIYAPRPQFSIEAFHASFMNLFPLGQDHTNINLFSIFMQKIPNADNSEPVWYYKDPQGDTQGPFSSINMDCWNMDKYFPLHLPIAWNQTVQFVTIEHFKNSPISLVDLAHRYGGLSRFIPNYIPYAMAKTMAGSAKLPPGNMNMGGNIGNIPGMPNMPNMPNMQNMQNMQNLQNMGNIFNKMQIPNYGGNLTNMPLNMGAMGPFNNIGNIGNINNMMNINTMNVQTNAKFPQNNPGNPMNNFKGEDTLMQLLRIVDSNRQINFQQNRMPQGGPGGPAVGFGMEQNVINNFQFQQMQPQQNNIPQNMNPNLMANLINNNPANNNGSATIQQNVPKVTSNNNLNNLASTNVEQISNTVILPGSDSQKNIQAPQQPKIDTNNLKMMLGLSNPVSVNNNIGNIIENEQTQKEKERREREKLKEKEKMERLNAEFPSLSESIGKKH